MVDRGGFEEREEVFFLLPSYGRLAALFLLLLLLLRCHLQPILLRVNFFLILKNLFPRSSCSRFFHRRSLLDPSGPREDWTARSAAVLPDSNATLYDVPIVDWVKLTGPI